MFVLVCSEEVLYLCNKSYLNENTEYPFTESAVVESAFSANRKSFVSWLGAMQAQNYSMVKWAVGTRLKSATIQTVEEALRKGEILRTHVMRPTWHLVAAEDIRWMLKLSARRIKSANDSFAKGYDLEITDELYAKSYNLLEKILLRKQSLTKQEIAEHFLLFGDFG